jgi:hypothetical protein
MEAQIGIKCIFLSYSSTDQELADAFYGLLCSAFAKPDGQSVEVFYARKSVVTGQDFTEEIFKRLREASFVVAVATPDALAKSSVVAEMAVALATPGGSKLLLLAVPNAYSRVTWPFEGRQYSRADDPESVRELLKKVGATETTPQLDAEVTAFCTLAGARKYQPPNLRLRRLIWSSAAAVALLVAGFLLGGWMLRPTQYEVSVATSDGSTTSEERTIRGDTIRLLYSGTLPAKLLSRRLSELHEELAQRGIADNGHLARTMMFDAIREGRDRGRFQFPEERLPDIKRHIEAWKPGTKGGEQVTRDDLKNCALPTEAMDRNWCSLIREDIFKNSADGKSPLDKTTFAVIQTNTGSRWGTPFAVTVRSRVELSKLNLSVANIAAMDPDNKIQGLVRLRS